MKNATSNGKPSARVFRDTPRSGLLCAVGIAVCLCAGVVFRLQAQPSVCMERPYVWMTFDNPTNLYAYAGEVSDAVLEVTATYVPNADGCGGAIRGGTPYSNPTTSAASPTDLTVVHRMKIEAGDKKFVFCFGSNDGTVVMLAYCTDASGRLRLQEIPDTKKAVTFSEPGVTITPPVGVDLTADFHIYAFTYARETKRITAYLDDAEVGSFTASKQIRNGRKFQFFSAAGGLGSTGFTSSAQTLVDDFRVYQRILSPAELAALRMGRTVPVWGAYLDRYEQLIWPNTNLRDIYRLRARRGGTSDSADEALDVFAEITSESGYVQFELYPQSEKVYEKVVRVAYRQDGEDVWAKVVGCSYINWQPDVRNGTSNLGHDFRPLAGKIAGLKAAGQLVECNENSSLATGTEKVGYGVRMLTADKLTDDGAAVRDGEAWAGGVEPAAGRPISFRSGSGTWSNPNGGVAYGTLAFGVESGLWDLAGESATFADVVNASPHRQKVSFGYAAAADEVFAPDVGAAGMTFRNLNVPGTFYPKGAGGAVHEGESRIGTYNTRLGLSVIDRPACYPSKRNAWTNMVNIARIVTASGSHTEIDNILVNMATYTDSILLIEGDTTIGTIDFPNDTYLVITNGTTTFRNGVDATALDNRWVHGFIVVHTDATLNIPSFMTYSRMHFFIDGRVNSNRFATPVLHTDDMKIQGAGELNLSGEGIVGTLQETILLGLRELGADSALLPIKADLNFETDPLRYAGPVGIRTATKDGLPATVMQTGAFTPNGEAVTVYGGGTFKSDTAGTVDFGGSLSVGDNTTVDFSSAAAFTVSNLVLGSGAELRIPYVTGEPLVTGSLALPETGTVLLRLATDVNFSAGDFALTAPGVAVDAAMAGKIVVSISGSAGSVYAAAVVYDDGALKLRVAKEETAMSAEITFPGYTGSTTLSDFPVQIRLPDCVSGFSYSSMHDPACADEIYFTDANGNTLAHEVEIWRKTNADLDGSLIWVKVPAFDASAKIVMHWGTARPAERTVAAASVWSAFAGVWHMNTANGSAGVSEPDATGNGIDGVPCGKHLAELKPEMATQKGMGYTVRNMSTADQSSNRLEMPNGYTSRIANMANITVSGWFNRTDLKGYSRAFRSKTDASGAGFEVEMDDGKANVIKVRGSHSNCYTPTIDNFQNNWVYLVVVYEGTTAKVYSNGALKGSGGITTAVGNSGAGFAVGGCLNASSKSLTGLMDEFRIASGSLSADWIKASYDTVNSVDTFSSGAAVAADKIYDFRDKTGTFVVDFDTAGYTVYAGADTVLAIPASGSLIIEPGMKATVREWLGTVDNRGHLKLTGSGLVTESHTSGTVEYAGTYTLGYEYVKAPTVSSGTNVISGPISQWLYTSGGPFTVAGGRLTLLGQVNCGTAAPLAGETAAAVFNLTGGTVEAPEGSFTKSDAANRVYALNVSGGRWTAPIYTWYGTTPPGIGEIDVSGTGVFAPSATGVRRDGSPAYNGRTNLWQVTVRDGGTFVLPDDINGLFAFSGGAQEGALVRSADLDLTVRFSLAAGTVLALDGTTDVRYRAKPAAIFAGAGTLALKDGVTLDLTEHPNAANFTGTIEVRDGATLILPSDTEPAFGIDVRAGGRVKAVLTTLPDETPPFLGAIRSLPESGTATLELELPGALPLGDYRLSNGAPGAGNLANLAVVFTGEGGATTGGALKLDGEGALAVEITKSDNPSCALEWAPADASMHVTTNVAVLAWKRYGSEDATRYPCCTKVPLHFTDAAANKTVVFEEGIAPSRIVVDATSDYVFEGEVDVDAKSFAKRGTGRLTVNAPRFPAITNAVVEAGTLGFGAAAREGVLGDEAVPVQVKSGATLDLSDALPLDKKGPLWNKTAEVAGEGVDGAGAVRRHGESSLDKCYSIRKIVLSDDTLLKGDTLTYTDRMDVGRGTSGGGIFDPETNKTLTVSGVVNVHGPVEVGALNIVNGLLMPEAHAKNSGVRILAPDGVTLGNGGEIRSFDEQELLPVDAAVDVVGAGAAIGNYGVALNQGLAVAAGADIAVNAVGTGTTTVTGGVTNDGTIAVKAGQFKVNGGTYSGEGVFAQTGGTTVFSGAGSAIPAATFAVTGGAVRFGEGKAGEMPAIGTLAGTIRNASTFIEPASAHTVGGEFDTVFAAAGANAGDVQLRAGANALTVSGATWDLGSGRLSVGNDQGGPGVAFENSTITAYRVCLGETPYGKMTWKSGTLNVTGGSTADGFIFGYASSTAKDESFTMEGGLLTTDKGAIRSYRARRDKLFMNLEAGTWRPMAYRWFESFVFPFAFGDDVRRTGREFVLDLDAADKFLNFFRISQGGSSDVRVTGSGYVMSDNGTFINAFQGVAHGRWILENASATENGLTGVASFESGLSLADGVKACVAIEGDGITEVTMFEGQNTFASAVAHNNTAGAAMQDAVANSYMMHAYRTGADWWGEKRSFLQRGRFYVPEAGTWYFAGNFEDYFAFSIDGNELFRTGGTSPAVGKGSRALTKGWHSFAITAYDGTGGQGPNTGAWKTRNMCLGWTTTETTSTDANDYQPFDNTTLRMASEPSVRWQSAKVSSGTTLQEPAQLRTFSGWTSDKVDTTLRTINTKNHSALALAVNRFSGYFYVDADHVGEWSFRTRFDDTDLLAIDGEEVFCNNRAGGTADWSVGTKTLTRGFHRWEFRCVDGGGGYGGKADGNVPADDCACQAKRPGDADYLPFDENLVYLAADAMKARHMGEGGIHGELALGQGAVLRNRIQRGACPIRGTLCGEGTLEGPFRFAGATNCWCVAGTRLEIRPVRFVNPDSATLAGLRSVEFDFTALPFRREYVLSDALGLTPETVGAVALKVKVDGEDANPRHYRLAVENGKLVLKNSRRGLTVIFR